MSLFYHSSHGNIIGISIKRNIPFLSFRIFHYLQKVRLPKSNQWWRVHQRKWVKRGEFWSAKEFAPEHLQRSAATFSTDGCVSGCRWLATKNFHDHDTSGQIIATSHDLTPKVSWGRALPLFQENLSWWNIIIWQIHETYHLFSEKIAQSNLTIQSPVRFRKKHQSQDPKCQLFAVFTWDGSDHVAIVSPIRPSNDLMKSLYITWTRHVG